MIRIQVVGLLRVMQRVQRMIPEKDFTPAPQKAAAVIAASIDARFSQQPWPASRRARKTNTLTLVDTGAMRESIAILRQATSAFAGTRFSTWYKEWHESSSVIRVWGDRVEVGIRSSYILKTQRARPVLVLETDIRQYILENWMKWAARSFALTETGGT